MTMYVIGVVIKNFCDQQYLSDRNERIFATSENLAIKEFIKRKQGWLQESEKKYIKVLEIQNL